MTPSILFWLGVALTIPAGVAVTFAPEDSKPRVALIFIWPLVLLFAAVVAKHIGY